MKSQNICLIITIMLLTPNLLSAMEEENKTRSVKKLTKEKQMTTPWRSRGISVPPPRTVSNSQETTSSYSPHQDTTLKPQRCHSKEEKKVSLSPRHHVTLSPKVEIRCSVVCFKKEGESIYFKYFYYESDIPKDFTVMLNIDPDKTLVYNQSLRVGENENSGAYKKYSMSLSDYISKCEEYDNLYYSKRDKGTFVISFRYTATPWIIGYSDTLLLPEFQYVNEIPIRKDSDLIKNLLSSKSDSHDKLRSKSLSPRGGSGTVKK